MVYNTNLFTGAARKGEYIDLSESMDNFLFLEIWYGDPTEDHSTYIFSVESLKLWGMQNFICGETGNGEHPSNKGVEVVYFRRMAGTQIEYYNYWSDIGGSGEIRKINGLIRIN